MPRIKKWKNKSDRVRACNLRKEINPATDRRWENPEIQHSFGYYSPGGFLYEGNENGGEDESDKDIEEIINEVFGVENLSEEEFNRYFLNYVNTTPQDIKVIQVWLKQLEKKDALKQEEKLNEYFQEIDLDEQIRDANTYKHDIEP